MGAVEQVVPKWGGGADVNVNMGEVLFGGGQGGEDVREGKETEWEVSVSSKTGFLPHPLYQRLLFRDQAFDTQLIPGLCH